MKLAKIIPIYKAKAKNDISNYRPISILLTISKIMEKIYINVSTHSYIHVTYSIQTNMAFVTSTVQ